MSGFLLKPEITIGNILTAVSIVISIGGLLVAWNKDRQLKRKEYADRIRHAAGTVIAKLERWRELSLRFFDDIQPLITDTDVMLTKEQDVISTRDFLWRGLVAARTASSQRILDEQIEIAYVHLYGYDPRIQTLFIAAVRRLRSIDRSIYGRALDLTQEDVLRLKDMAKPLSAQLGNALRDTCGNLATECGALMDRIVMPFRREMIRLIEANDSEVVNRRVRISIPDEIFPPNAEESLYTEQLGRHTAPRADPVIGQIRKMEQLFEELNQRRKAGEITLDDFQREVDKLKLEDAEGNQWTLGADGRWYQRQGDEWVLASPPPVVRAL